MSIRGSYRQVGVPINHGYRYFGDVQNRWLSTGRERREGCIEIHGDVVDDHQQMTNKDSLRRVRLSKCHRKPFFDVWMIPIRKLGQRNG